MSLFRRDDGPIEFNIIDIDEDELLALTELIEDQGGKVTDCENCFVKFMSPDVYGMNSYPRAVIYDVEFIVECIKESCIVDPEKYRLGKSVPGDKYHMRHFLYGYCIRNSGNLEQLEPVETRNDFESAQCSDAAENCTEAQDIDATLLNNSLQNPRSSEVEYPLTNELKTLLHNLERKLYETILVSGFAVENINDDKEKYPCNWEWKVLVKPITHAMAKKGKACAALRIMMSVLELHGYQKPEVHPAKRATVQTDVGLREALYNSEVTKNRADSLSRQYENSPGSADANNILIKEEVDLSFCEETFPVIPTEMMEKNYSLENCEIASVQENRQPRRSRRLSKTAIIQQDIGLQRDVSSNPEVTDIQPDSPRQRDGNALGVGNLRNIQIKNEIDDHPPDEESSPAIPTVGTTKKDSLRNRKTGGVPTAKSSCTEGANTDKQSALGSSRDKSVNKSKPSRTTKRKADGRGKSKAALKASRGNVGNAVKKSRGKTKISVRPFEIMCEDVRENLRCITTNYETENGEKSPERVSSLVTKQESSDSEWTPRRSKRKNSNEEGLSDMSIKQRYDECDNGFSSENITDKPEIKSRGALWRSKLMTKDKSDHTRSPFTSEERKIMLQYLLRTNSVRMAKGLVIWKAMIEDGYLTYRTPQSLQNHFRKRILPNIAEVDYLLEAEMQQLLNLKPAQRGK